MTKYTSKLRLPYPEFGDPAAVPNDMLALASKLDSVLVGEEFDTRSTGDFVKARSGFTLIGGHFVRVGSLVSITVTLSNQTHDWDGTSTGSGHGVLGPGCVICTLTEPKAKPQNIAQGFIGGAGNSLGVFGHVIVDPDGTCTVVTVGYGQSITPGDQVRLSLNYPSI